jgi:hypothetical protein
MAEAIFQRFASESLKGFQHAGTNLVVPRGENLLNLFFLIFVIAGFKNSMRVPIPSYFKSLLVKRIVY